MRKYKRLFNLKDKINPPAFSAYASEPWPCPTYYEGIYVTHMPWLPQKINEHITKPETTAIF